MIDNIQEKYKEKIDTSEAQIIEAWTSFFIEPTFAKTNLDAVKYLRSTFAKLSTPEKADRLLERCFDNNKITSFLIECLNELMKVYEAKNRYENAVFIDKDGLQPEKIRELQDEGKKLIDSKEFEKTLLKRYATYPHDFIVLEIEEDEKIEVDYVSIRNLINYKCENNEIQWAIFKDDEENKVYAWDNVDYSEYKVENDKLILIETFPHGFDSCPVTCITFELLRLNNEVLRTSLIVQNIGELRQYLHKYLQFLYAYDAEIFKILVAPETNCDYNSAGAKCVGGKLYIESAEGGSFPYINRDVHESCPLCAISTSPGSLIKYKLPMNGESVPNPLLYFIEGSVDSLKFQNDFLKELRSDLWAAIVGDRKNINYTQAQNQDQISAGFESEISTLQYLRGILEPTMKWVYTKIYKRKFGEKFLYYELNLGDDYYLFSAAELEEIYKKQKEAGMSQTIQLQTLRELIETKYRTNPNRKHKELLKLFIEPYPTLSISEVFEMYKVGVVSQEDLVIKANFDKFVKLLEIKGKTLISYSDNDIEELSNQLREYVRENISLRELGQSPTIPN